MHVVEFVAALEGVEFVQGLLGVPGTRRSACLNARCAPGRSVEVEQDPESYYGVTVTIAEVNALL